MARGFVAGFLKKDDRWIRHWINVNEPGRTRQLTLEEAKSEIVRVFGVYCGGEAVARRKIIWIDAICSDGREMLEKVFDAMRSEQPTPDET